VGDNIWLTLSGGTGKTYLTSRVIDHVKSNFKKVPHNEGFAFFYCNRSGSSLQQPIVVLRSFVRQLSGKAFDDSDEIQSSLIQKCAEAKNGGRELSYKDCEELMLQSFNVYSRTTVILDALDESDITVYNLAKQLIQMARTSKQPVRIFISSRPDREYLKEVFDERFLITVDAGSQHDDIQQYLEDKLYSTERFKRRKQKTQDEIKEIFNTKGSGM
jgi:Cdc6-like AAA superfamily ATPase